MEHVLDAMDRLRRYSGKVVAVQLRTDLFMLSCGGTRTVRGESQPILVPAAIEENGKMQLVGFSRILPSALMEVSEATVLLHFVDPMSGAELEISLPPDEIIYVTVVSKEPSRLIAKR